MEIKAILFDMDGVLIDSEDLILRAAIDALKEFGVNAVPEDFSEFVGAGENKFVGGTAEKHGVKFVPEMKDRTYEYYGKYLREAPGAVYCDVKKVLLSVKGKYKIAVCSAADLVKVQHNLAAIGVEPDFFDCVVTGSDVTKHKPDPEVFLTAANKMGIPPEYCLVAEDSLNGIEAARRAGMHNVAIATTFSEETLREKAKPEHILQTIARLEEILV